MVTHITVETVKQTLNRQLQPAASSACFKSDPQSLPRSFWSFSISTRFWVLFHFLICLPNKQCYCIECIYMHGGRLFNAVLRLSSLLFVFLPWIFAFKGPKLSSSCFSPSDTLLLSYLWSAQRKTCPGTLHHSNTAGGNIGQEGARKKGWKPYFLLALSVLLTLSQGLSNN